MEVSHREMIFRHSTWSMYFRDSVIKGSQGGYFLEKAPELITVAEIVEALEGSYYLEDEEGDMSGLRGDQEAIQHLIIDRINEKNREILEDITLKDLVEAFEGYQDSVEGMYYI